jgi:hypothetical protein
MLSSSPVHYWFPRLSFSLLLPLSMKIQNHLQYFNTTPLPRSLTLLPIDASENPLPLSATPCRLSLRTPLSCCLRPDSTRSFLIFHSNALPPDWNKFVPCHLPCKPWIRSRDLKCYFFRPLDRKYSNKSNHRYTPTKGFCITLRLMKERKIKDGIVCINWFLLVRSARSLVTRLPFLLFLCPVKL